MIQGKPLACIVCISPDSLQQVQFIMYVLEPSFLQFINYEYFPSFCRSYYWTSTNTSISMKPSSISPPPTPSRPRRIITLLFLQMR